MANQNKPLPPLYMQDENGILRPVDPAQLQALQQDTIPPQANDDNLKHQVVHVARPLDPQQLVISPETQRKHEESKIRHPSLNLSDGEYVILAIRRHPIGLFPIWGVVVLLGLLSFLALPLYASARETFASMLMTTSQVLPSAAAIGFFLLGLLALFVLGGVIATAVYLGNKFYLTNESVIQVIKPSLFSTNEQTVSLGNIEDASYQQQGILQSMFNYGSLRLSTEGDETTYRFSYVDNPKTQVSILNNAVEAFKNGRPVD